MKPHSYRTTATRLMTLAVFFLLSAGLCRAADDLKVEIKANDQMKYDTTEIDASPGQKVIVTITNVGTIPKAAMSHNFVLLKAGVDVTTFATAAMTHATEGYMPPEMADKVIASSKLLGPGESDMVTFVAPEAGSYAFLCTFPGHALAGMHGVLIVK